MKTKKGLKTTLVAVVVSIAILVIFSAWWLEKIDTSELQPALTAVGLAATMIGLWLAKDASASHTKDDTTNPSDPKPPKG